MSSVLTQNRKEMVSKSMENAVREPVKDAFKEMMEEADAERRSRSRGRRFVRTLTVLGIGAAVGYALEGGAPMPEDVETADQSEQDVDAEGSDGGGRGLLPRLILGGTVLGVGYALKSRSGSVDEVVDQATEQVQTVADQTVGATDQAADKVTAVTGQAAEEIEETGEEAAETLEEGGEEAADQIEEVAEGEDEQSEDEESES
jgi:hypothetical protein